MGAPRANAYEQGRTVEAQGIALMRPFLRDNGVNFMLINDNTLGRTLGKAHGDMIWDIRQPCTVEIKTERRDSPNFFIEMWSNKLTRNRADFHRLGHTAGWIYSCHAMFLAWVFLETQKLHVVDLFDLHVYLFGQNGSHQHAYDYPEKTQGIYAQENEPWGRCVKISDLRDAIGVASFDLKQLQLFDDDRAIIDIGLPLKKRPV